MSRLTTRSAEELETMWLEQCGTTRTLQRDLEEWEARYRSLVAALWKITESLKERAYTNEAEVEGVTGELLCVSDRLAALLANAAPEGDYAELDTSEGLR